jgi:hypothetical protein
MPNEDQDLEKMVSDEVDSGEDNQTKKQAFNELSFDAPQKPLPGATTKIAAPKAPIVDKVETLSEDDIDLDKLDESTLMKYDIKCKTLDNSAMMALKPSHNDIVLRWVYNGYGSKEGRSNVNRRKGQGFQFALVDDIEGGVDSLVDAIVEGDQITCYDVVLMKISKVLLMGHYKFNLLTSHKRVNSAMKAAKKGAEAQLVREAGPALARAKQSNQRVEIYTPGAAELNENDPNFLS